MARIDIAKPYEEFLKKQVEDGLFRSITAAAEHAISTHMKEEERKRIELIHALIAKGEKDIAAGRTYRFNSQLMDNIIQKGKSDYNRGVKPKFEIRGES